MATANLSRKRTTVRTHEGAPAKRIGNEAQLRRSVMACMLWERTFYEDGESVADRIAEGVRGVPQHVASQIAIEAREQMHLRHAPLWIVRGMARRGGREVGDTLARVIQRADELTEFVALYWKDGKEPLSAQVKRGLAEAFMKFDEYQLAKYDRDNDVRLRDVLFLCHAKPKDADQAALWSRLVDGTMATPDTWETSLSAGGDKNEHWTRLLKEGKLGGLALLRNLRNMTQANVDESLVREAIRAGNYRRVLPFRFIAAAMHNPSLEDALEEGMFKSLSEMPTIRGKTALVLDNSASMSWDTISKRSELTRTAAAGGLAMLIREVCEHVTIIGFGSIAAMLPNRRGFALAEAYERGPGGGTYTEKAKQLADDGGYDRVIIVTDEQSHQQLSDPLPGTKGYVLNVGTYKNGIGYGAWTHIDGWSESVVRYIQESENAS